MATRALLFACQGCPEHGDAAHEVASVLDARGFAEAAWLGGGAAEPALASKARSSSPVYAIEGCAKRCAGQWLGRHGVKPRRQFILASPGDSAEQMAARIMEGWRL